MRRLGAFLVALPIGLATALVIVGVAVALLLNPLWIAAGQDRAESGLLTGYGPSELRAATDAIVFDLVIGPPDFDVEVNGQPVLNERERGHLRDVRLAFIGLYAAVAIAAVFLVLAAIVSRRSPAFWRRVARGGRWLAVLTIIGGFVGLLFFDAAFVAFHELLFPPGTWTFDPATERLVQLFPNQFWIESTVALGVAIVILGFVVASWARGRAKAVEARRAALLAPKGPVRRTRIDDATEVVPAAAAATADPAVPATSVAAATQAAPAETSVVAETETSVAADTQAAPAETDAAPTASTAETDAAAAPDAGEPARAPAEAGDDATDRPAGAAAPDVPPPAGSSA